MTIFPTPHDFLPQPAAATQFTMASASLRQLVDAPGASGGALPPQNKAVGFLRRPALYHYIHGKRRLRKLVQGVADRGVKQVADSRPLPKHQRLYRGGGLSLPLEEVRRLAQTGELHTLSRLTSFTTNSDVADHFSKKNSSGVLTLLSNYGVPVSHKITAGGKPEDEVMLPAGTRLRILEVDDAGNITAMVVPETSRIPNEMAANKQFAIPLGLRKDPFDRGALQIERFESGRFPPRQVQYLGGVPVGPPERNWVSPLFREKALGKRAGYEDEIDLDTTVTRPIPFEPSGYGHWIDAAGNAHLVPYEAHAAVAKALRTNYAEALDNGWIRIANYGNIKVNQLTPELVNRLKDAILSNPEFAGNKEAKSLEGQELPLSLD